MDKAQEYGLIMENPATGEEIPATTWGRTRDDAYARVVDMMQRHPEMWAGWWFTLADEPSVTV